MIVPIKSIHDLRNEIVRLETLNAQQQETLKQRFSSPKSIYKTLVSMFESDGKAGGKGNTFNQDMVSMVSKFLIPFTLNRTVFRGSGFITRSVVGFLSSKASGMVSQDKITSSWEKVKDMLAKVKLPEKKAKRVFTTPKTELPMVINTTK